MLSSDSDSAKKHEGFPNYHNINIPNSLKDYSDYNDAISTALRHAIAIAEIGSKSNLEELYVPDGTLANAFDAIVSFLNQIKYFNERSWEIYQTCCKTPSFMAVM
jgi:hypothetical protein